MDAPLNTTHAVAFPSVAVKDGEAGQGLVEYAVMLMLVALVVLGALATLGTSVDTLLQSAAGAFP